MAKSIKNEVKAEEKAPAVKFQYLCPGCSGVAIETSNKMLDVEVDCANCGKRIMLNDVERYTKI